MDACVCTYIYFQDQILVLVRVLLLQRDTMARHDQGTFIKTNIYLGLAYNKSSTSLSEGKKKKTLLHWVELKH